MAHDHTLAPPDTHRVTKQAREKGRKSDRVSPFNLLLNE